MTVRVLRLYNDTGDVLTVNGITLQPNAYTTIPTDKIENWVHEDEIIEMIVNGDIIVNDGSEDLPNVNEAINWLKNSTVFVGNSVHQTPRKKGHTTYFTSSGDNQSSIKAVGNSDQCLAIYCPPGESEGEAYVDFNIIENNTWIREGYVQWVECKGELITCEIVPRVADVEVGSNTSYNIYGGYLVIPAAGDGTAVINSDISDPMGPLVYMPLDEFGNRAAAFWNAVYDPDQEKFTNIVPAPAGDGEYNIFSVEVPLSRFVNKVSLSGDGQLPLKSDDSAEVGHGMRFKLSGKTIVGPPDHAWKVSAVLSLYREKTV